MGKIDTERLRYDFWKQLLEKSKKKTRLFSRIRKIESYAKQSFISAGAGISGVKYQYVILARRPEARVQLSIETEDSDKNKEIFDALKMKKQEIERDFDDQLCWNRIDQCKSSRIKRIFEGKGLNDIDSWTEIQNDLVDAMVRLKKALSKHIRKV